MTVSLSLSLTLTVALSTAAQVNRNSATCQSVCARHVYIYIMFDMPQCGCWQPIDAVSINVFQPLECSRVRWQAARKLPAACAFEAAYDCAPYLFLCVCAFLCFVVLLEPDHQEANASGKSARYKCAMGQLSNRMQLNLYSSLFIRQYIEDFLHSKSYRPKTYCWCATPTQWCRKNAVAFHNINAHVRACSSGARTAHLNPHLSARSTTGNGSDFHFVSKRNIIRSQRGHPRRSGNVVVTSIEAAAEHDDRMSHQRFQYYSHIHKMCFVFHLQSDH